jgi:1-pyrroline-5-carboxylate dehydrogenase
MIKIIKATNEPIKAYLPNSIERKSLQNKYDTMAQKKYEIPLIINGEDVKTGILKDCVMPHEHKHVLANFHNATEVEVEKAIESSLDSWKSWSNTDLEERTKVFRKAAILLAGPWRNTINAATMLNQSKNVYQAEIDSACELIDFFNFNAQYAEEIYSNQPLISPNDIKNHLEYRPLEGFILAITPFNFTSIAGNLPCAPALMGNVAIWKPASSAILPCYFLMKLLEEAGLPRGVINFIPGKGSEIGNTALLNKDLSGVHFTGSTKTFQHIWKVIGKNINNYKTYPRIVGETGGKDFCFAHETVDIDELITAMIRGAFEYQGQKCSALSRVYIPDTIWPNVKKKYLSELKTIKMGSPRDFTNFMNAVIDQAAFNSITEYIKFCKTSNEAEIISGGEYDDTKGYFIEPTTILTSNPKFKTMQEEIFGPVLTIYVYDSNKIEETMELIDNTSPYALTGSIMGSDKDFIYHATKKLRHSAGNFYINDKPTGAVVGQQPFGGSRASGTNDKAGSDMNLLRWTSVRTIKESYDTANDYRYPFLKED